MGRGDNLKHTKIMCTFDDQIFDFVQSDAHARGITFQELIRFIVGEYFISNGGKKVAKAKVEAGPQARIQS